MRRALDPMTRPSWLCLGLLAALLGAPTAAKAQVPQPHIPDVNERSGLLQRFRMFKTNLPQDPYRDTFYGSRYGDHGKILDTNTFYDGGLYGVRLPAKDTASVYPFFFGSPGRSTITEESRAWKPSCLRAIQQLTHQRKPVGMYYDRGSYVPIYDLDSFSPGPGPDYFPWFFQGSRGG
ncbi:hypothetical protein P12x_005041 [Tundrisphaera lichenicola]|uniref:hypothetical protein n=1 Tax=Tundrisphaera lichenicola TaxID=2029860 RepID=UPI003EBB66EC